MAYDLNLVKRYVQGALDTQYSGLNFDYEFKDDEFRVTASLKLRGHDDGIRMMFSYYKGGMATFRAIFDKIKSVDSVVLSLLNQFNADHGFLSTYVSENGYLVVYNTMAYYEETLLGKYTCEFMSRVSDLSDDETLKRLTQITVED